MAATMTWANLSTLSSPNWPAVGMALLLHALVLWGMTQVYQPWQRLDFGSPLMVRVIVAPPAPKPVAPPPAPKVEPTSKPEPQPRVKPEPVKRPEPEEKPLITQRRPEPVAMEPAPPPPKPQPPQVKPRPTLPIEPKPQPPRAAPVAEKARPAPVTPPNIMAAYQNNPPPLYPMRSRYLGEQGNVLLRVHITADGHVDELTVRRSSGHKRLDEAALEAVREWRFAPARRGEKPVAAWVLVPIYFRLS